MKKRIHHLRLPVRKSNVRLSLLALACACIVHAFFLFGFRVASIPIGSWASRDVLLWITSPYRSAPEIPAPRVAVMSFIPGMNEREPRISSTAALSRFFSASSFRKEFPAVFLSRRAGTVSIEDTASQSPPMTGVQRWRVDKPAALDRIMKSSWHQMRTRPASQKTHSDSPAVLAVDAAIPGGIRQISVLSSSGSDLFDAEAAAFIRSLPFAHDSFVSEPGDSRRPALYRAIIAVTIEAEPGK
jgi:hypothetical protein